MAAVTTKRPKASAVKQASIKDTNAFLQSLPEKPKEELSLREAIDQMRDSVRGALAKGYTYQELAAMLTEKGIKISAFTLKNYVPSGRRRSMKDQPVKTGTRRGRKAKADVATSPSSSTQAAKAESSVTSRVGAKNSTKVATNTATTTPAKTTRGSGKATAAKTKAGSEATVKQPTPKQPRSTAAKTAKAPATRSRKKAGA
uniref:Mobilization protein MobC n=1 Tax=Oscillatoriales cyanobacterium SpSt-402 TaxID=2282168 RepID=A0A832M3B9_9CYAN